MAGVSVLAFFFDVSAVLESIGTDRVPIFDRPVSGRETLSQLVFVLALHFVQHLDGSPPGLGQPVQTHSCSPLQPQRWPTSAPVMSTPGSDDLGARRAHRAAAAAWIAFNAGSIIHTFSTTTMAAPASAAALIYAPCPSPITIEIWGSILDYFFINHTLRPGHAGPPYPLQETPYGGDRFLTSE